MSAAAAPFDADIRVTCTACRHYAGGCCTNARKALLTHRAQRIEIGAEFAALRQHCPGHEARGAKR